MQPSLRRFATEDDYWKIRDFLRRVFLLNDRRELSWQVYRFDYWRWHGIENMGHGKLETDVFLWETAGGELAAVLNREAPGSTFLQVHPDWKTVELEEEMIATAEEHLTRETPEGRRRLALWCHAQDRPRQEILTRRGYIKGEQAEYQRRRALTEPIPEVPVAPGYQVRALGDVEEYPARSLVSWKAFHPNDPEDQYQGWHWYHNIARAPLFRRDLDLIAVAPSGEFASFCTVWFDDVARTGAFEPVGTIPAHQQRGLGKAVMTEALRRLQRLGATLAFVGSYSPPAHALYASVGFTDHELCEPWIKEWEG